MSHLAAIGLGYSAQRLAEMMASEGWRITGTSRTSEGAERIRALGYNAAVVTGKPGPIGPDLDAALQGITHLLVSTPPTPEGDPVVTSLGDRLAEAPTLRWVGYFSTIGVYGDRHGEWVNEAMPPTPTEERGRLRLAAEMAWRDWGSACSKTVNCLRLPAIYGPGRSPLERIRTGAAQSIVKAGQVFNRIHVDDIAGAVRALMTHSDPAGHPAINITDDLPAPPQDVLAYAAELLGLAPPPEVAFEDADLSAMTRSFFAENKRVSNSLLTSEFGYRLRYPTYREGLAAMVETRRPSQLTPGQPERRD